jgi:tRNA-splicing endonuclease subunit Sen34
MGLPLQLLPQEVALLMDRGLCQVVTVDRTELPSSTVAEYHQKRQDIFQDYKVLALESRRQELVEKAGENMGRKRRKAGAADEGPSLVDKNAVIERHLSRFEVSPEQCPLELHTPCPWPQRLIPVLASKSDQTSIRSHSPLVTRKDFLKFCVFKDLWEKGYCITSGFKFGCDFLLYEGDPVQYHAKYIVICREVSGNLGLDDVGAEEDPEDHVQPLELLFYGRLGGQVRKETIVASVSRGSPSHRRDSDGHHLLLLNRPVYRFFKWRSRN